MWRGSVGPGHGGSGAYARLRRRRGRCEGQPYAIMRLALGQNAAVAKGFVGCATLGAPRWGHQDGGAPIR